MPEPKSIAAYIAAQHAPARAALVRVHATLRKALPGATEGISYRIPIFKLEGRMVLYFAGFRQHYSIYPATGRLITVLGKQLEGHLHNKATIRFFYTDAVPVRLITRIAKLRAAEAADATQTKKKKAVKPKAKPKVRKPARHVARRKRTTK